MPKARVDAEPSVYDPNAELVPEEAAPEPEAEPEPEEPQPEPEAEPEADAKGEPELPAQSASKADWVAYAVELGYDEDECNNMTKQQLIEALTS
jgi:hypothetical protein